MGREKTLYEILQVAPEASAEVIQGAYRALLKNAGLHPDLGGTSEVAQAINEAYAILSNGEARREYDEALRMAHVAPEEQGRPFLLLVCPHCRRRNLLEDERDLQRARCRYCKKPLERRPSPLEQVDARAFRLGIYLFDKRMYDRARREFQATVRIKPREPKYHYWLGRTHYQQRSLANARAAFTAAAKLNPRQFHYHFWRAQVAYSLRDFSGAAEGFLAASKLRKAHIPTLQRLGMCYYRLKEFEAAVAALTRATASRTARFEPLVWLGLSHMAIKEFSSALKIFQRASKLQPQNSQIQNYLEVCEKHQS